MTDQPQGLDPFQQTLAGLLERIAQSGDQGAFAHLYRLTSGRLNAIVYRILRDERAAEDVLQEIYLNIWNKSATYSATRAKPMTWIITIARNRAIDRLRASRVGAVGAAPLEDVEVMDHGLLPIDRLLEREQGQALKSCLEALEERQRGMIVAAFFDGFTYEELAHRRGVPLSTMKSWIRRGLGKLRQCLDQHS